VLLVCWLPRAEWGLLGAVAGIYLIFVCGMAFRAWSEGPYSALMIGSLVCLAAAVASGDGHRAAWLGLGAGALAGGAAMCRYPGIVIIPALGLAALVAPLRRDNAQAIRRSAVLPMVGGAALIVGPWIARNLWLTGVAFGPQRPPSERPLMSIISALGASVYLDFGAVLLALLFAAVGYHALRTDNPECEGDAPDRSFLTTLALAALLCAAAHVAIVLLAHILWQVDEPPDKRHFFPAYLCALLAGLALIAMARPPEGALRRRWPIVLLLALPLVIGPMMAGMASRDVTPQRTALEDWVEATTGDEDLIIGHRAWPVRFYTGRPVLQSGQATDPSVYDGARVAAFLRRFGGRFGAAYLLLPDLIPKAERRSILDGYEQAGLQVQETADVPTREHDGPREFVMRVYRVSR